MGPKSTYLNPRYQSNSSAETARLEKAMAKLNGHITTNFVNSPVDVSDSSGNGLVRVVASGDEIKSFTIHSNGIDGKLTEPVEVSREEGFGHKYDARVKIGDTEYVLYLLRKP